MFPHPCLYAGDFNCRHADWGYDDNSPDGECLAGWASINCLANAKDAASFYSGRWNTGTNPDLAFASVGPNSRLPDRRVLDKFPRLQHRPSLITPPRFAMAVPSMPVKRWNFHKAKWSHYIALTNKFAKTLLPPDSLDVDAAYQDFCNTIKKAAKKTIPRGYRNNYIPCWDAECESLYKTFLQSPQSYRPISLLCVPYKILERLIYARVEPLIDPLLPKEQAGFRRGKSTVDQVVLLTQNIEDSFEAKKKAAAVFIDLTAAYDTVWHRGLTCKLLRLLSDKHMVRMIMELVRNRSFTITTGDSKQSRLRCFKNGVPQGSVLAPLLFNIYTYILHSMISRKFAYADDLALLHSSGN